MPEPLFIAPPAPSPEPSSEPPPRPAQSGPSEFSRVLAALGREVDRGQDLVDRTLAGATRLDAAQLIALQAGIYRFSESIDLIAKLVDRSGQAIRTVMNGSSA